MPKPTDKLTRYGQNWENCSCAYDLPDIAVTKAKNNTSKEVLATDPHNTDVA
jgi:hypothetical protein